ncbi:hypothetical protein NKG94_34845 [Micromonospora sp. M12]
MSARVSRVREPAVADNDGAMTGDTIIGLLNRRSGGHERSEERS